MRKIWVSILAMTTVVFAAEPIDHSDKQDSLVKTLVEDEKRGELSFDCLDDVPAKGPLPETIGEPMKWIVENSDKWRGWSLTGYSWGGLSEDLNPWRVKVGMINGDINASRKYNYDMDRDMQHFAEWERQMERAPVLGVSIIITF